MIKFEGVMPALVTPLTKEEKLNSDALKKLMVHLMDQGAYGFYVGGATGEGLCLDREVREQLAFEAIKNAAGKVPVIMHIASINIREAISLAKNAEQNGASAISAIPPMFFRYDEDDVFNYYKKIAESVNIPLMVYYNLSAGFNLSAEFASRLFTIDNVTAIKWTCSDYYGVIRLKELTHGEMNVINGCDEMLLPGLSAGADGGIGLTYNFQLPDLIKVYDNFKAGDIQTALKYQTLADKRLKALQKYMTLPGTKAIVEKMGFDVGDASFPMKHYSDETKQKIYDEVMSVK